MKLSDIKNATKAELLGEDTSFSAVSIDTRTLAPNTLFIAIEGERFDGHDYVSQALEKGAKAVMVSKKDKVPSGTPAIVVKDTVEALGQWAAFHRRQFNIPCVGITGSCGKTTVKGMLGEVLQTVGPTLVTSGNFNNQIGLPLTLLQLNSQHQFAVIEMGANGPHDIEELGVIAQPTVSGVLNVHPAHLQGFGSLEGVANAKGAIYEALCDDGVALLNIDSDYVESWKKRIGSRETITFGTHAQAMFQLKEVECKATSLRMTYQSPTGQRTFELPTPGAHNAMNALVVLAFCQALGIELSVAEKGLAQFKGVPGRLNRMTLRDGLDIIDDTYNANPGSVQVALDYLAGNEGQTMFVMGEMGELGADAAHWHAQIGRKASDLGIGHLWGIGPLTQSAVNAFGPKGRWFPDKQALLDEFPDDWSMTVLVKGSRSAGLETFIHALRAKKDS